MDPEPVKASAIQPRELDTHVWNSQDRLVGHLS